MSTTLLHSVPSPIGASTLSTIDALGIPFAVYATGGALRHASEAAVRLFGHPQASDQHSSWDRLSQLIAEDHGFGRGGPPDYSRLVTFTTTCIVNVRRAEELCGPQSAMAIFQPTPADRPAADLSAYGLTPREEEVARLVAAGRATKTIALLLGISFHTARHHKENVYEKLGVRCRVEVTQKVLGVS
jgi:DNA-binding CsgD family transcriptional regulator